MTTFKVGQNIKTWCRSANGDVGTILSIKIEHSSIYFQDINMNNIEEIENTHNGRVIIKSNVGFLYPKHEYIMILDAEDKDYIDWNDQWDKEIEYTLHNFNTEVVANALKSYNYNDTEEHEIKYELRKLINNAANAMICDESNIHKIENRKFIVEVSRKPNDSKLYINVQWSLTGCKNY